MGKGKEMSYGWGLSRPHERGDTHEVKETTWHGQGEGNVLWMGAVTTTWVRAICAVGW